MAQTMSINGKEYEEAPTPKDWLDLEFGACTGCALVADEVACEMAIDSAAKEAFGGDCDKRDVVYQLVQRNQT